MLRVYNYMGLGLVMTGLVAFIVGTTPALYVPIFSTPLKWVVMLAPLAVVLFFSFRMQSMSASGAQTLFWAFCAVVGVSLASIFLVFTGTSIARTFFIAAAMFGATSLYGYTTKRDLSQFGSLLIMGLIGVVIASLVNLFLDRLRVPGGQPDEDDDADDRDCKLERAALELQAMAVATAVIVTPAHATSASSSGSSTPRTGRPSVKRRSRLYRHWRHFSRVCAQHGKRVRSARPS